MKPAESSNHDARFVDLHMHSTASDGLLDPEAVVAAAGAAGLSAIALTDHDAIDGIPKAVAAGARIAVRVIAGVELSGHEGGHEIHVIGLHLSNLTEIERNLAVFRANRHARAERIVEKLNALGVPLRHESVLSCAGPAAIGRPHIARAMVTGGWVRNSQDAFDRYLGGGRPAYVGKQRLPLLEAIRMVHEAGGLAIVAHPGSAGTRARIEAFAALGFDGIEVKHPGHTAEDMTRLSALADHFGMVPSGGSDWHGDPEGARSIGNMRVPYAWLERQDARVQERAAHARVA